MRPRQDTSDNALRPSGASSKLLLRNSNKGSVSQSFHLLGDSHNHITCSTAMPCKGSNVMCVGAR